MSRKTKIVLRVGAAGLAALVLGVGGWIWYFYHYTPAEVMLDLKAGMAARREAQPVPKYMEARYGPMTEPANRQKAFLEFFNVGHIKGMHFLVRHMPAHMREPCIKGMAQWIADYRRTMTPAEREALREHLNTDASRGEVRQATLQYLSHDVYYRGATAGVIAELMTTLTEIQNP